MSDLRIKELNNGTFVVYVDVTRTDVRGLSSRVEEDVKTFSTLTEARQYIKTQDPTGVTRYHDIW